MLSNHYPSRGPLPSTGSGLQLSVHELHCLLIEDRERAWERFDTLFRRPLTLYARGRLGCDPDAADELAHETLLRWYCKFSEAPASFDASLVIYHWLRAVCRNLWIDRVRRSRRCEALPEEIATA